MPTIHARHHPPPRRVGSSVCSDFFLPEFWQKAGVPSAWPGREGGQERAGLHCPSALGGLQQAEDAAQAAQKDGDKEEDEADPGAEAGALPGAGLFCRDHVGQVQHVAQGPADGRVPGLRK